MKGLRKAHGSFAAEGGTVVVEVPPVDELPPLPPLAPKRHHKGNGIEAGSERAKARARAGGLAKAAKGKHLGRLGLATLPTDPRWAIYLAAGEDLAKAQARRLARAYGELGPGPSSILQTAGLQLAASRYYADKGELDRASKLGDSSRQNVLAAYHLAALEAGAKPKRAPSISSLILDAAKPRSSDE
jgi:hypothetical protein